MRKYININKDSKEYGWVYSSEDKGNEGTTIIDNKAKGSSMKNKFNLSDIILISGGTEEYKIVGMNVNTYNKPKKIWYTLYRLSDGYVCVIAENLIALVS